MEENLIKHRAVSHHLPQISMLGHNMRMVQSKSSSKKDESTEEAVLHFDETSKIVTISNDGKTEMTEIKEKRGEEGQLLTPSVNESVAHTNAHKNLESQLQKKQSSRLREKAGKEALLPDSGEPQDDKKSRPVEFKKSYFQSRKQATRQNKPLSRNGFRKRPLHALNKHQAGNGESENLTSVGNGDNTEAKAMECDDLLQASSMQLPRTVILLPGEIPSEDKLQKMLEGENAVTALQHPIQLLEGDMKWAKVTGHPYWPCMISKCPFTKLITRMKGDARCVRLYHVQFFGDECERGWIPEPSLMDFEGKSVFLEKASLSLKKTPKKGKTSYNPFLVKDVRQTAWNVAVAEAEHAWSLAVEDRSAKYAFQYCHLSDIKKERKELKEKQKVLETLEKSPQLKAEKGVKRKLEGSGTTNDSPGQKIKPKRRKLNGASPKPIRYVSFEEYLSRHVDEMRAAHPDWNLERMRIELRKRWKEERGFVPKKLREHNEKTNPVSDQTFTVSPNLSQSPEGIPDTSQNQMDVGETIFSSSDSQILSLEETESSSQPIEKSASPKVPLKRTVSFQVYFTLHAPSARKDHPDWSEEMLRVSLRKQWKDERKIQSSPGSPLGKVKQRTMMSYLKRKRDEQNGLKAQSPPFGRISQAKCISSDQVTSGPNEESGNHQAVQELVDMPATPEVSNNPAKRRFPRSASTPKPDQPLTPTVPIVYGDSESSNVKVEQQTKACKVPSKSPFARKASQDSDSSSESKKPRDEPYELEIFKLNSTSKLDKEKVCSVCEKPGDVVDCLGTCGQNFHPLCVKFELKPEQTYTCNECVSGIHTCFSCKEADSSTAKCSISACGKYFHESCVKKYRLTRFEAKGFVCPMHTCVSCAVDNIKNPKACKGRFFRCIRCPVSYHVGDLCIPAGSTVLGGSSIICADHFKPNKGVSCHSRLNINWCFTCSKGGTLLCCEACPAAYHAECVKVEKTPDEAWFCEECEAGRRPLYGNIVWIKVGNYRWWPGEVCHPRNVPLNIQEKSHQLGEFPVRFFGSHDYYWIHRGRMFLFQEDDKASRDRSAKGIIKVYMKGVEEATEAFKKWTAFKDKKDEQEQERADKRPAPFKFVKWSVPIGSVQMYKADLSEIPVCECKPGQEEPCTSDCLNRMMLYECHPASCPAGEKCNNQRFQKRLYPDVEPVKCENRGWGLRCQQDIKKGQFVMEYVGDIINEEECKKRIGQAHEDDLTNFYMLTLDKNRIIDAGPKGNYSRFMNHSCCPNMVTQKWTVNGDIRVGLFALEDIPKGSELTFNYNFECLGNEKKACSCGAENCSGFLGVRPKASVANTKEKLTKELKKKQKKKKLEQRKIYEDDCFRCGEGGELVMCDVGNCPKVYHLQCLKLTKPPIGKWRCPWHHCDECGKHAVNKCIECPDSFCLLHSEGNIFEKNGIKVCEDHIDLLDQIPQMKALQEAKLNAGQGFQPLSSSRQVDASLAKEDSITSPVTDVLSLKKSDDFSAPIKEKSPQKVIKRKYTKRCKSELLDSGSDKCPILKITLEGKHSNGRNAVKLHNPKHDSSQALKQKPFQRSRSSTKLPVNKSGLTNGHHIPQSNHEIDSCERDTGELPNLTSNERDDEDITSNLVIDV